MICVLPAKNGTSSGDGKPLLNKSFTVEKSSLISLPDTVPTAVAHKTDSTALLTMVRMNLINFSLCLYEGHFEWQLLVDPITTFQTFPR